MKRLTITVVLLLIVGTLSAGYKYRISESTVQPQEREYLQNGILVRWDIQQDSTMYKYKEMWVPEKTTELDIYNYINHETQNTLKADDVSVDFGKWKEKNKKWMLRSKQ